MEDNTKNSKGIQPQKSSLGSRSTAESLNLLIQNHIIDPEKDKKVQGEYGELQNVTLEKDDEDDKFDRQMALLESKMNASEFKFYHKMSENPP